MHKVAVAGNKDTTGLLMKYLIADGWPVECLVTLKPDSSSVRSISGYQSFREWRVPGNLKVLHPATYSLNTAADREIFWDFDADILFVVGWQRLIPDWLLNRLRVGAFGMHGSSEMLPKGRGRSPLNWSIIQGKKRFITNLFKYHPGIDDGDIVDSYEFNISDFDTGGTLQTKNTLGMIGLLQKNKAGLLKNSIRTKPQQDTVPTYYPKRRPEDGEILWGLSAVQIGRLVRAVTNPFPGAFSFYKGYKITIWEGIPLEDNPAWGFCGDPGEIISILSDGSVLVKTGEGIFCVTRYTAAGEVELRNGDIFVPKSPYCWDWDKLPVETPDYCSGYDDIPEEFRRFV